MQLSRDGLTSDYSLLFTWSRYLGNTQVGIITSFLKQEVVPETLHTCPAAEISQSQGEKGALCVTK